MMRSALPDGHAAECGHKHRLLRLLSGVSPCDAGHWERQQNEMILHSFWPPNRAWKHHMLISCSTPRTQQMENRPWTGAIASHRPLSIAPIMRTETVCARTANNAPFGMAERRNSGGIMQVFSVRNDQFMAT